ncbi:AMP-activated serine/threonine-protein kinase regulatory [Salix suchowensis]|nr:AMP-activated serine/threonine-protein kinase regulatory [Salix suchowensis]
MSSALSPTSTSKRKLSTRRRGLSHLPPYQSQESHDQALTAIRTFLKSRTNYDAFPVSFRLIVLDTKLNVKKALQCLLLNGMAYLPQCTSTNQLPFLGVVSAPLWNSDTSTFAGMLTVLDIIHLIQYYYHTANWATAAADVETFRLESLRGTYVSRDSAGSDNPYYPIATAKLSTTVFDVVHMFSERSISAVPVIDDDGVVLNMYETVDVITLVRLGAYQSLDLTISEALAKRSPDFPGVIICTASDSLGTLLELIKKRRVHRLVVVEGDEEEKRGGKKGRLLGIITLSDVLRYVIGAVAIGDAIEQEEEPPQKPNTPAPAS